MKNCKICGFINQDDAVKCASCNSDFAFASTVPQEPLSIPSTTKSALKWPIAVILLFMLSCAITIMIALLTGGYIWDYPLSLWLCETCIFIILVAIYIRSKAKSGSLFYNESTAAQNPYDPCYESALDPQNDQQTTAQTPTGNFSKQLYDVFYQAHYLAIPEYDGEATCTTAMHQLTNHPQGLETRTARTLLAALASRRAIVLCGNGSADFDRVCTLMEALTGEKPTMISLGRNCTTPNDLYISEESNVKPIPSPLLCSLYTAHAHQRSIYSLLIEADAPDKLEDALTDIYPYLENSALEGQITVKEANNHYANVATDEVVAMPANTRLLFVYRPGRSNMPAGALLQASAFINLNDLLATPEAIENSMGALSFDRLMRLCDDAEERYYLTENNWKKIDELISRLASGYSFSLGNKLVTAMERFVGIYMATGGTEQEALDAVLASILLPAVLSTPPLSNREEDFSASQFLDSCFGLENLPACTETLKKFNIS